jgi:nucleoid-associated protein YgaU
MGMFDFVFGSGDKIFGGGKESDEERSAKLENRVRQLGLDVRELRIDVKGDVATVSGKAGSQQDKEKTVLAVGNTQGIAKVDDRMSVVAAETAPKKEEARFYTVKSGDTLSKIAKEHYGDAKKYPAIFEANKPMLSDPNKIYPGQVLRIPPSA